MHRETRERAKGISDVKGEERMHAGHPRTTSVVIDLPVELSDRARRRSRICGVAQWGVRCRSD